MKKIILILLTLLLFLSGCSITKPKVYYFLCNEQEPDLVYTYFPLAINSVNYSVIKIDKDSNLIIASKSILVTNKPKGIERQSIQIIFNFNFDGIIKSKISQYYIVEMNGKQKIKKLLNQEQLEKYEKDIITLQEKLLFYCNPNFKGR